MSLESSNLMGGYLVLEDLPIMGMISSSSLSSLLLSSI
jgi:hypothetical protein